MNELVDKLELLNYHRDFCLKFRFKPLVRTFFEIQQKNTADQFFYFASLTGWLFQQLGQQFQMPGQFDDPNTSVSNIYSALKQCQIEFEDGPTRLKQPFGESILQLLNSLVDKLLFGKNATYFPQPTFVSASTEDILEADSTELAASLILDDEIAENDDIIEDIPDIMSGIDVVETRPKKELTAKSSVDINRWKMEVERVAPRLKIILASDNRDWRIHLQQLEQTFATLSSDLKEAKEKLDVIANNVEGAMDKITSREKYINTQFAQMTDEYKISNEKLSQKRLQMSQLNDKVGDIGNELTRVSDDLEILQAQMDDLGTGMNDPKPLVQIKQAKSLLEIELNDMNVKIAVLRHEMAQKQLHLQSTLTTQSLKQIR